MDLSASLLASSRALADVCGEIEETSAHSIKTMEDLSRKLFAGLPSKETRVTLNIGGRRFATSSTTLTSIPFFRACLSETYRQSDDGEVFVDRDGAHFHLLLSFLRGSLLPETIDSFSPATLEVLSHEGSFYQMPDSFFAAITPLATFTFTFNPASASSLVISPVDGYATHLRCAATRHRTFRGTLSLTVLYTDHRTGEYVCRLNQAMTGDAVFHTTGLGTATSLLSTVTVAVYKPRSLPDFERIE